MARSLRLWRTSIRKTDPEKESCMSLFSKKYLLFKVILSASLCFIALPAHGMMGRLRTAFQKAQQAAASFRTPFVSTCTYTVPQITHNEIALKPFTKKHSFTPWVPALALGVFVAYNQDDSNRWAARQAYAQKEFKEYKDQQFFIDFSISMTSEKKDPEALQRFASFELKHQAALLTFYINFLDKYRDPYIATYISSVLNEAKGTTLSFSQEQLNLFLHLPGEWQAQLLVAFADRLTDEQIIDMVNTPHIINLIQQDEWFSRRKMPPEQMHQFALIVLKNGSPELKKQFFYKVYTHLYQSKGKQIYLSNRYGCVAGDWQELKKWTDALDLYDSLEQVQAEGPLFSDLNKNLLFKLHTPHEHPNIDALLPVIAEYVAEEYKQNRIVLFHAHASDWIGLGALYRTLDEYKHGRKLPRTFFHTRFWTHSPLSEDDVAKKELEWKRGSTQNVLLFTTLHFADGYEGNNTLQYVLESFDQMIKGGICRDDLIEEMFVELGMISEYQKLLEKRPTIFQELCNLCDEAIKEQGNYGELFIISMPKELARKLSYLADDDGRRKNIYIDKVKTSDTVTIAELFRKAPFNKQIILKLSEEIINPEAAEKAGVKIIAVDPAAYWRTEKYRKVEAKIQEIIELIKEMQNSGIIENERLFL